MIIKTPCRYEDDSSSGLRSRSGFFGKPRRGRKQVLGDWIPDALETDKPV